MTPSHWCNKMPINFIYFQGITIYGVTSILERIGLSSGIKSKWYTITIATIYTAMDSKQKIYINFFRCIFYKMMAALYIL